MKNKFLLIPCLASALLFTGQTVNAQDATGLIDFARIQREYYRTDVERKKFEADRVEKRAEVG